MDKLLPYYYRSYGMYVNHFRSFPLDIDGCKPVERRVLLSAYDIAKGDKTVKSARVDGHAIGHYSPHGTTYGTIVSMVNQGFLDGQGNFGSKIGVEPTGPAAMRYCFSGDTRVMTENGLVKIINIVENNKTGINDINILVEDRIHTNIATKWIYSGRHKTLKIKTNNDYEVSCTPNEPFLILNSELNYEWKLASELKSGDHVCIKRGSKIRIQSGKLIDNSGINCSLNTIKYSIPNKMSENLAIVLGYLVSEGTIRKNSIMFCNTEQDVIDDFIFNFNKCFPDYALKINIRPPSSYGKKQYTEISCNSTYICKFFSCIGLDVNKSKHRVIPEIIFNSSRTEVAKFLSAYYEGDGSIGKYGIVEACSSSEQLLKDIKLILLNYFGIISSKIYKDKLKIIGSDNLKKFIKFINFRTPRKNNKLKIPNIGQSLSDIIPINEKYILTKLNNMKKNNLIIVCENGTELKNIKRYNRKISRLPKDRTRCVKTLIELSEYFKLTSNDLYYKISDIIKNDYYYAIIKSIEENNYFENVYDLTVPTTNSFIANGFVVHNTEVKLSKNIKDMAFELIDHVPWIESELDLEPIHIPTMFPLCLMGTEYTIGIGFGYKTYIPCYTVKDLHNRLLWLLGERKTKPTIKPITDCNILASDQDLEELLTTGKAKIEVKGKYELDPKLLRIIVRSWPPGSKFETILKKINTELDSGDVAFSDISSDGNTRIMFEVIKQRNRQTIYENLISKLDSALTGNISFEIVVVDLDRNVKTVGVDDMLKKTHTAYVEATRNMLNSKITELQKTKDEYEVLEKIRPHLKQYLSNDNIEEVIEELVKKTKVDEAILREILSKYRIKKLFTIKTDISEVEDQINGYATRLGAISEYVLGRYKEKC